MTGVYINSCCDAVNRVSRTAYNNYSYAYNKYANTGYSSADNYGSYNSGYYPSSGYYGYSAPSYSANYSGGYNYSTPSYSFDYNSGYDYSNGGSYYQYNYPNPMSNDGSIWQNSGYYSGYNDSLYGNNRFDYYNNYYRQYYQNNDNADVNAANPGDTTGGATNVTDYNTELSDEEAPIAVNSGHGYDPGSFGGALATGAGAAVIGIPGIQKGLYRQVADVPKVRAVTDMFWRGAGVTEAGQKLWRECPNMMVEFEGKMNELNVQFSKIAAKNPNSPVVAEKLNELNRIAENAIRSGKPERIAQADIQITEALNASKGEGFLSKLFNRGHIENATIKSSAARAAEESAAKTAAERTVVKAGAERSAIRGTLGRSMFKGAGAMAVLSAGIDVIDKKSRGEEINWTETGTRAVLSSAAFCIGERVAIWGVGKIAGRVAGACAGKAIGAAIGSVVPGIGTAIGFVVGCIADWAINKYVMPKLFPEGNARNNDITQIKNYQLLSKHSNNNSQNNNVNIQRQQNLTQNQNTVLALRQSMRSNT